MHEAATATMIETDKILNEKLTEVYTTTIPTGGVELPAAVTRMVGLIDGTRTLEEVCSLCGLQPHKGVAVAHKLEALGMICRGGEDIAFSLEEEQFFAAELPAEEAPPEPPWARRVLSRLLRRG